MTLFFQLYAFAAVAIAHTMTYSIVMAGYWLLLVVPVLVSGAATALWLLAADSKTTPHPKGAQAPPS